jgi:hypothetical protein
MVCDDIIRISDGHNFYSIKEWAFLFRVAGQCHYGRIAKLYRGQKLLEYPWISPFALEMTQALTDDFLSKPS